MCGVFMVPLVGQKCPLADKLKKISATGLLQTWYFVAVFDIYTHTDSLSLSVQLSPSEDRAAQEILNDVTPDSKETGCKQFE